jgi:hypothetical protein
MKRSHRILIGAFFLIGLLLCIYHPVAASSQHKIPSPDYRVLDPTGLVTPQGILYYYSRLGGWASAPCTKAYLWDDDISGSEDLLFITYSNDGGFFYFPALTNDDNDDPSDPNRHLDLYVVFESYCLDSGTIFHKVTNFIGLTYTWLTPTYANVPDEIVDLSSLIPANTDTLPAMWIFQDLRHAWVSIYDYTLPHFDPGSVTVKWEDQIDCFTILGYEICNSFYYGLGSFGPFIFIQDEGSNSPDTVVHEVGYRYMDNATGWWWWNQDCWDHTMFSRESLSCSWSEGWGDFVALVTNRDPCYDFEPTLPCMGAHYDLENQGWGDGHIFGETVEGRVAGALYDMFDTANEAPYDSASFGLDPIADIVFQGSDIPDLGEFWVRWKASGQNQHHAVKAFWQNTINYDNRPRISPPLPDREMYPDSTIIINLWSYAEDEESTDAELSYEINASPTNCGVSLQYSQWIYIIPQPGWLGRCVVGVGVSDGIWSDSDSFDVTVGSIIDLPIIMK